MNPVREILLEAQGIHCQYRSGRGIHGVCFNLPRGECLAVLGRNGAGKSTLIRLLAGLEPLSSGKIRLFGRTIKTHSRAMRTRLGIMLARSVFWERLSGLENACFMAQSYGAEPGSVEKLLGELFAAADLAGQAHGPVEEYSYGMRRKLHLISLLAADPDLLLLDEPTLGLDAHFQAHLAERIRSRGTRGKATLLAGNDPDWLGEVADRAAFMDEGRILALDTVETLIGEAAAFQELRVTLECPTPMGVPELSGVRAFEQSGNALTVVQDDDPALIAPLLAWIVSRGGRIRGMEVRRGTLRDAFLIRTGRPIES